MSLVVALAGGFQGSSEGPAPSDLVLGQPLLLNVPVQAALYPFTAILPTASRHHRRRSSRHGRAREGHPANEGQLRGLELPDGDHCPHSARHLYFDLNWLWI